MATNQSLRYLSAQDVRKALSVEAAIDLMRGAFHQLSTGQATVPVRVHLPMPRDNGAGLFMPAYLPNQERFGLKIVSVMNNNPAKRLPLIHALVVVFNASNGRPLAMMDGEYLTAIRTGAASGLATDLLARQDAQVVAIFGAGTQARTQLEAVCAVRAIKQVYVFNRTARNARQFAHEMNQRLSVPITVVDSEQFLPQTDIICTATPSTTPLFSNSDLKPGIHVNAIGSYRPDMCEVPAETIVSAKVVVDQREACLAEAGELIQPLEQGLITEGHIHAEIGEIVAGGKKGRETDTEITVFKSVGNAVQDLAAAVQILENAEKLGLGTKLPF